ncbi:hypothetical protein SLE2022_355610 [Rubroshorea leprosula]
MDARLANTWRLTVNEKNFIKTALQSEIRIDGRKPYEYRKITIVFGRDDGSSEVQVGQTRVMGIVTAQLVQPYRDRPNEGTLSIFTEFSPMADPSFEPGRPGESAVELGRIVDRGLRESRAVDTESLCVLAGKLVWAIRIDLHILDNGGNLVDAANIAALAALLTFRRPECSLGGEDGQQVIVHPPEVREPLPLTLHHLPIAVTFGFFNDETILVIDPTHNEEAVMAGRMTATVNANGDICAIQKAGGEGVTQRVIMQCLQLAIAKAAGITKQIKEAVETYKTERSLRNIKHHPTSVGTIVQESQNQNSSKGGGIESPGNHLEGLKLSSGETCTSQLYEQRKTTRTDGNAKNFIRGPASWDPYSKGVDPELLKTSLASRGMSTPNKKQDLENEKKPDEAELEGPPNDANLGSSVIHESLTEMWTNKEKTLEDAVKPKSKRKKKASSKTGAT